MLKVTSYSTCIAAAVVGAPQRGIIHSAFDAAANVVFPGGLMLSLNATSFSDMADTSVVGTTHRPLPGMPNGLQLTASPGTYPFTALRASMPVLFGAQRLHIESIGCSLDLSLCSQWSPYIERPAVLDIKIIRKNRERLGRYTSLGARIGTLGSLSKDLTFSSIHDMAQFLCGRGRGLTPAGDDMLAGWMAAGWLVYGPVPSFLDACQHIVEVAKRRTHLLSQCWLKYAAEGNVASPISALLDALTRDDERQLAEAVEAVLAMGASSGYDLIQGILLMLYEI